MKGQKGNNSVQAMVYGLLAIFSILLVAVSIAAQENAGQGSAEQGNSAQGSQNQGATSAKPAQPWVAPPDAAAVKNPVPATPQTIEAGKSLYEDNCLSCHGDEGKGDGIAAQGLSVKPANFTDPKLMKSETDGALFWKMSNGKGPMPSWKGSLSETERWQLVDYIRTFLKSGADEKNAAPAPEQQQH